MYAAKYDGSVWNELGGVNGLSANNVIWSICRNATGNIYAAGGFRNISGNWYVAEYNIPTDIDSVNFSSFNMNIFPNPTENQLKIDIRDVPYEILEVYDSFGSKVYSKNSAFPYPQNEILIDVSEWNSGIYFVKVKSEKGIHISKFLKK